MAEPHPGGLGTPDPHRIVTRRDFGAELTLARLRRNLSVRHVARQVGVAASTLGGYFAGTHLPALQPPDLLPRMLHVLGIAEAEVASWWEAYWRVRGPAGPDSTDSGATAGASPGFDPTVVSTRAPLDRLLVEPTLRGRDDLINHLNGIVARSAQLHGAPRVHVLHGLGGCGKSMVSLAVADRAAAKGITTFWISAVDRSAAVAGLRALAVQIGVPVDRLHGGSLPDSLWQRLSELNEPWLLVFDNADDPPAYLALPGHRLTDGTGFLRAVGTGLGTVLVSTRDGARSTWGDPPPPWLRLHRLTGLDRDDGAKVLAELAGDETGSPDEGADLSDRLGGLPLALKLTGRYLAESRKMPEGLSVTAGPRTYRDYLTTLHRGGYTELTDAAHDADLALGSSWSLSLDLLTERGLRSARPLLYTLACLGAAPIPYADLLNTHVLNRSPLFPGITTRGIWDVLQGLDSLGFITMRSDGAPPSLDIHPLVRDTARHAPQFRAQLAEQLTTVTALLGASVRDAQPKSPLAWPRWSLLASHCTAPLDLLGLLDADANATDQDNRPRYLDLVREAVALAGRAGEYLRAAGLRDDAENTLGRAVRAGAEGLLAHDPAWLALEHELARLRHDQGRYDEAEQLYRSVLAARSRSLGHEHPDTLTTQYYLARTLRYRHRLDEADRLLRLTYQTRLRLFGEEHPDTLTSRHGLADLLRARGAVAEAVARYGEVLASRRDVLGERHPATLVTRQYRAELLHELGRSDEAERELRWLWSTSQEVRGPDHPRSLTVGHSLAGLLQDRGHLDDAATLAGTVLEARQRLLGATHPATMDIRHRLGLIELDQGRLAAALANLAAVLVDRTLVLGAEHPQTQLSRETVNAVRRRVSGRDLVPQDATRLTSDRAEST